MTLIVSKAQLQNYYNINDIELVAQNGVKLVFLNTTKLDIVDMAQDIRCGLQRAITIFGKKPELLKLRPSTIKEIEEEKRKRELQKEEIDAMLSEQEYQSAYAYDNERKAENNPRIEPVTGAKMW